MRPAAKADKGAIISNRWLRFGSGRKVEFEYRIEGSSRAENYHEHDGDLRGADGPQPPWPLARSSDSLLEA